MYTNVNGMRSARFPLQGLDGNGMFRADIFGKQTGPLGCCCGPSGIGQTTTPAPGAGMVGAMLPILALGALVVGVGVMASGGGRKHVAANRRRRRR